MKIIVALLVLLVSTSASADTVTKTFGVQNPYVEFYTVKMTYDPSKTEEATVQYLFDLRHGYTAELLYRTGEYTCTAGHKNACITEKADNYRELGLLHASHMKVNLKGLSAYYIKSAGRRMEMMQALLHHYTYGTPIEIKGVTCTPANEWHRITCSDSVKEVFPEKDWQRVLATMGVKEEVVLAVEELE